MALSTYIYVIFNISSGSDLNIKPRQKVCKVVKYWFLTPVQQQLVKYQQLRINFYKM